jgi:hypothetical protein
MPFIFLPPSSKMHTEDNEISFVYVVNLKSKFLPLLPHHTFITLLHILSYFPSPPNLNPCNNVTQLPYNVVLPHCLSLSSNKNLMVKTYLRLHQIVEFLKTILLA